MKLTVTQVQLAFGALLVLSFVIARIPVIGKYLRVVNTLIHETGHSLMTLLTDGQVIKVELFSDTSGTTVTKSKSKFGQFMIAFAGYPIAAGMAYFFIFLIYHHYFSAVIITLTAIAFINLLFFVRNAHGIIWIVIFIALAVLNMKFGNRLSTICFAVVISAVNLLETLWSCLVITLLSFRKGKSAGDATNLHKLTHVPAFIWALLFLAMAAFAAYRAGILLLHYNYDTFVQTPLT